MKIYHTETQADYDALMVELEADGIETLPKEYWPISRAETTVVVRARRGEKNSWEKRTTNGDLSLVRSCYDVPITKYKAKVDEKMKFTKENVYKMVAKYRLDFDYLIDDLKSDIFDLEYTPEKVAVPKFVADVFSSELHFEYEIQESRNIPHVLSAAFSEGSIKKNIKFLQWVKQYPDKYVMAVKYGYTIEPEQLYYIPLPDLQTSDGIQQVLSQRKGNKNYFASRPNDKLKQRYTKEELKRVPVSYKPYAKPIEEEEE